MLNLSPALSTIITAAAVAAILVILGKVCYKKAPPNLAMVITGPRGSRTMVGRGCLVIPVLQRVDYMSLENIQSDFTSRDEIPTKDAINIMVDAVANVSIAKDPEGLKIAASKFLGYSIEQIKAIIPTDCHCCFELHTQQSAGHTGQELRSDILCV